MNAQELGAKLQAARLEKKLSVEQVSRVLSLRPSLVSALENGNYREIGALLYVKNYLRKYGKFLGIPCEEIESDLEQLTVAIDPKSQGFYDTSKVKHEAAEKKRSNHFKYYLIFVVIVIAIFAYLYQSGVIPSPFKDRLSSEGKEEVSLPNERLPSLELEYSLRGNEVTQQGDVSFEDLLIDSVKQQQTTMLDEIYFDESLTFSEASSLNESLGEDLHLVMLNKENELVVDSTSPPEPKNSRYKTSGKFEVLGTALRYYAPLLSATALPIIDLGSNDVFGRFTVSKNHIQYLYESPDVIRLGLELPAIVANRMKHRAREVISLYDRDSGFYPFVERVILSARIEGQASQLALLSQEIDEKQQFLASDTEEIPLNPKLVEAEMLVLEKLMVKASALQEKVEQNREAFMKKALFKIIAEDITTLDVKDPKGRIITNRVMKRGDEYQLEGQGIYDVYLGNPAVIDKITVNGKMIPEYYYRPLTEEAVSIRFSLNSDLYR